MTAELARVAEHPRVRELGRTPREQERAGAFATDLARWLHGADRDGLGALARVVTTVAHRELATPRRLCRDRPLLAVEAAARAAEAMWPHLRGPLEQDEEEEPPPEQQEEDDGAQEEPPPEQRDEEEQDDEDGREQGDEEEQDDEEQGDEEEPDEEPQEPDEDGDGPQDGEGAPDRPGSDGPSASLPVDLAGLAGRLMEALGAENDPIDLSEEGTRALQHAGRAAAQGAIDADRAARHLEQFLPGVGWSSAPGLLHHALLEDLDRHARLLERLDELKRLADALGRIEEASRKEGREEGGSEEVVGVRLGGEVSRALPCELALLADPETEDLFYQRLLERRLVSLELSGAGLDGVGEGDQRGPVIACIDTSASMHGAPEAAAKALVLAVCRRVLPQGRTVHLLLFGGPGERTELRLRRGAGGLEGLLAFLGMSFHAGTDFDSPLVRALELLEEQELRKADVLVVTDGLGRAAPQVVERVHAAREARGVRVWSVVLGTAPSYGVEPFSDEVWQLDPKAAADAVGLVRRFDDRRGRR